MMSLLTRFALLSSVIYLAVPGVALPGPNDHASARVARLGLPASVAPHAPPELKSFGRAIGFNPRGLEKLRAQLARTTLPTAAERDRAARRLAELCGEAQRLAAVAARTGGVVGQEAQTLWRHRRIIAQIGRSLDRLDAAKAVLSEGAQNFARE